MKSLHQAWKLGLIFFRLGCTSFGGPIAHLGYFHHEFVQKRGWFSEQHYADMVALCQFLPGPASSQVGMMIGLQRAGYLGALMAWVGFTLPSALLLITFAFGVLHSQTIAQSGVVYGLKIAAVAIVIQAVWGMGRSFCHSTERLVLMLLVLAGSLFSSYVPGGIFSLMVFAALYGGLRFASSAQSAQALNFTVSKKAGLFSFTLFLGLLWGLPLLAISTKSEVYALIAALYQAGALVFGGGHVVLPLLQNELATYFPTFSENLFLAGYGATQAVPGPLFTVAAYLGAVLLPTMPWWGAALALVAIFLPAFLLVVAVIPYWQALRHWPRIQGGFSGVNAGVVGVLLAALYQPLWTSSINENMDFLIVAIAVAALVRVKIKPSWVVVGCSVVGAVIY